MLRKFRSNQLQLMLIDLRDLAESIGLDWWAAKKLYDDKWLSFDPEISVTYDPCQEAEFRFLGSLVAAGCDPHILKRLLTGLEPPYCYDINSIYYDWNNRCWADQPYDRDSLHEIARMVSKLEEDGDIDALRTIDDYVRHSVNQMEDSDEADEDEISEDSYLLYPNRSSILCATRNLLWRLAGSSLLDDAAKVIAVGTMFQVIQNLPKVTPDVSFSIHLTGPTRTFGTHEIFHWWDVELEDGTLRIGSGGHFYRQETGGDSFTSVTWTVYPGCEPEENNYLHTLSVVDDADFFENEVEAIDFRTEDYKLTIEGLSFDEFSEKIEEDEPE